MRRRTLVGLFGSLAALLVGDRPAEAGATVGTARVTGGSYAGDGAASRLIAIPFGPRFVYLASRDGTEAHWLTAGVAVQASLDGPTGRCFPTNDGFLVGGRDGNASGVNYTWVAIG